MRFHGKGAKDRAVRIGPHTARAVSRYLRAWATRPGADLPALWLADRGARALSANGVKIMLRRSASAMTCEPGGKTVGSRDEGGEEAGAPVRPLLWNAGLIDRPGTSRQSTGNRPRAVGCLIQVRSEDRQGNRCRCQGRGC